MMLYVAAAFAAVILIGGVLFLLGRGAERRERRGRHRRGLRAGDGVDPGDGSYQSVVDAGGGGD